MAPLIPVEQQPVESVEGDVGGGEVPQDEHLVLERDEVDVLVEHLPDLPKMLKMLTLLTC
jgi:hypothetical protein